MDIHIFKRGENLADIARQYNIPLKRLEMDNDLVANTIPTEGQALIIIPPERTYTVKEGDTLESIAEANQIPLIQLLRNNPDIFDSGYLYEGEELVISYAVRDRINVMGYTSAFVQEDILRKTLPSLTYLTILNYRVDPSGNIQDIYDAEIIRMALEYNVAPIMFLSSMTDSGRGSYAATHSILNDPEIQDRLINNMLRIMEDKGYLGVNLAFIQIMQQDLALYADFVARVTQRLNGEGYIVFVTLSPNTLKYQAGYAYFEPYFEEIGRAANYVILITYLWQEGNLETLYQTTAYYLKEYLDFVVTQIPPEKIMLGLTRIAYDWELPYIEGETIGAALSNSSAIDLAEQLGAVIGFDEITQTPYFYYNAAGAEHYVWFKDARSVQAILDLVKEYGLYGIAVWNIMYYYSQTWLSINSEYIVNTYDNLPLQT
ncbi:MAG TPA: LysM peptidoglycan-binding domain-containing protein [Clostridiales bacterium]|nr:LysM peptidoglycan-binding domain-containing protein [Clostridiales bacterium]